MGGGEAPPQQPGSVPETGDLGAPTLEQDWAEARQQAVEQPATADGQGTPIDPVKVSLAFSCPLFVPTLLRRNRNKGVCYSMPVSLDTFGPLGFRVTASAV